MTNDKIKRIHEILKELEDKSSEGHYFNIPRQTAEFLYLLVKVKKAKNILEVGMSNGYSTVWLATAAGNKGKITTIERDELKIEEAEDNFKRAGLSNITILKGDAVKLTKNLSEKYDFVFLDATKKEYITYLKNIINNGNLEEGAIITADDVVIFRDKVHEFLKFLREDKRFESTTLPLGNGLEFSVYREK